MEMISSPNKDFPGDIDQFFSNLGELKGSFLLGGTVPFLHLFSLFLLIKNKH